MTTAELHFSDFVTQLQSIKDHAEASIYAEKYISLHIGTFPIVEGTTAHFLYRAPADMVVGVSGEWNGWNARKSLMTPIGGGLLHYQRVFEADARLDYLFVEVPVEDVQAWSSYSRPEEHIPLQWQLDPLNSRQGKSGFGARSELAMPAYQRPLVTLERQEVGHGTLQQRVIKSEILRQERTYTVYLPHGYTPKGDPYASVYFHDGGDYLTMGDAPIILDALIQSGDIPPVVAIFVSPVAREEEYNCNDEFVSFFCDELVSEMQRTYHLATDASKRCVIGPSMGGIISLYLGNQRPEVFGLVCAQSSAIKTVNGLEKFDARVAFAVEPLLPLKLHLVIGTYEVCFGTNSQGKCHDLFGPVQELCAVLERFRYQYRYREDHQGHSWGLWRDSLADALTYLFAEQA